MYLDTDPIIANIESQLEKSLSQCQNIENIYTPPNMQSPGLQFEPACCFTAFFYSFIPTVTFEAHA
jgi:hypothetical protein